MREHIPVSIAQHTAAFACGATSVVQHIERAQARGARLNPVYRAFSHLCADIPAQAQALQTELVRGVSRGPMHGLAVSVKGNIPVAGLPWTEGSEMYAARTAVRDAGIVTRARAAGGVVLGTTTLSELAMYGVTNAFEPLGLNPWDVARTAGGSSTGAAVAAALDLADVNIGTDSGGSIRNPACHCGVVGLMPRIGSLTLDGKPNHTPSLSSVGLIGRSVEDVETTWAALSEEPGSRIDAPRRRVLVPRQLIDAMCDAPTLELFARACERLAHAGFELIDAEVEGWMAGEHAAGVISLAESASALARMDLARASDG
ncbi:MAG: amidase, partial [Proteobacteria bacterium]|nr:amidase [Burkholderiales bacterium]